MLLGSEGETGQHVALDHQNKMSRGLPLKLHDTTYLLSMEIDAGHFLTGNVPWIYLFVSYYRLCSAHVGYIGADRNLLTGHNALLLRQIARDLLHALAHRHNKSWHGLC